MAENDVLDQQRCGQQSEVGKRDDSEAVGRLRPGEAGAADGQIFRAKSLHHVAVGGLLADRIHG